MIFTEVLTKVLHHEALGIVVGEHRHQQVGACHDPTSTPGDQGQSKWPTLLLTHQEPGSNGYQKHPGVFADQGHQQG